MEDLGHELLRAPLFLGRSASHIVSSILKVISSLAMFLWIGTAMCFYTAWKNAQAGEPYGDMIGAGIVYFLIPVVLMVLAAIFECLGDAMRLPEDKYARDYCDALNEDDEYDDASYTNNMNGDRANTQYVFDSYIRGDGEKVKQIWLADANGNRIRCVREDIETEEEKEFNRKIAEIYRKYDEFDKKYANLLGDK